MDHHSNRTLTRDGYEVVEGFGEALVETPETAEAVTESREDELNTIDLYYRQAARVPLLDREGEVVIARRIESADRVMHSALALRPALVRRLVALARKPGLHAPGAAFDPDPAKGLPDAARESVVADAAVYREIGKLARRHAQVEKRHQRASNGRASELSMELDRIQAEIAAAVRELSDPAGPVRVLFELDHDWKRLLRSVHRAEKALEGERKKEARAKKRATLAELRT